MPEVEGKPMWQIWLETARAERGAALLVIKEKDELIKELRAFIEEHGQCRSLHRCYGTKIPKSDCPACSYEAKLTALLERSK